MCPDGIDGAHPHHQPTAHLSREIRRLPRSRALRAKAEGGHGGCRPRSGHGDQIIVGLELALQGRGLEQLVFVGYLSSQYAV